MASDVTLSPSICKNPNKGRLSVLIVDDDPFTQNLVSFALGNYTVVGVLNATDVLKAYSSLKPDMVFLDIMLPDGNGIDLIPQIMKIDPAAHIIMMSGQSYIEAIKKSMSLGAKSFISKPINVNKLHDCVHKYQRELIKLSVDKAAHL